MKKLAILAVLLSLAIPGFASDYFQTLNVGNLNVFQKSVLKGPITNTGAFTNVGALSNTGAFTNVGAMSNTGTFGNTGTATVTGNAIVTGSATVGSLYKGTLATPSPVTMTASYIPAVFNLESQTNPSSAYTLGALYGKAGTKSGVDQTNTQIVGVLARAAMNSDVLDAYATQSHLTIASGASSIGNMTAVSGKTILADSVGAGIVTAGLFTLEGPTGAAVSPGTAYGVWADIVDVNVAAGIMVHANGSTLASGLKFAKTGTGAITKDITLQNGETIDNATDGTVSVGGALAVSGATKLYKRTLAEILAITPAVGDAYLCSDCAVPYSVAIATGTGAGEFGIVAPGTLQ